MSIPRVVAVVGALGILLEVGCAGRATRPTVTAVNLALAASSAEGSPSVPVVADVRLSNVGTTRVWHCEGCSCGNGIGFTVLGPDGDEVWLRDPNAVLPMCPDGVTPLEPGQALGDHLVFAGTLYEAGQPTSPSRTYPAPAGTYTVVARFSYATAVPGEWVVLERRASFAWVP
jgi:hypothetical protein